MKIIDKALSDLTPNEYRACWRHNFGDEGYMRDLLKWHRNDTQCRAIIIKQGRYYVGWALLVPTKYLVNSGYGVSYYASRRSKYALQVFIPRRHRRKGHAKKLFNKALKYDSRPYVWPHDKSSGEFYGHFDVTCSLENRWENLKSKKRKAA